MIVIRPARPDDAPRIHELHTASVRGLCSGQYAADVIEGWLLNRAPESYLAEIERGDARAGFRDVRRSTVHRNHVDIPVIVMAML